MHRNSQKRIIEPGKIYFITTTTDGRFPYFQEEILCWLFLVELKFAMLVKKFKLHAFCILYDHVHLMIEPNNEVTNISKIMQFLKRHFSRNANIIMEYSRDEGDLGQCRLPRERYNMSNVLREKMDSFVLKLKNKYKHLTRSQKNEPPPFRWQKLVLMKMGIFS